MTAHKTQYCHWLLWCITQVYNQIDISYLFKMHNKSFVFIVDMLFRIREFVTERNIYSNNM